MTITIVNTAVKTVSGQNVTLSSNTGRLVVVVLLNRSSTTVPTGTFDGANLVSQVGKAGTNCRAQITTYAVPDATAGGNKALTFTSAYAAIYYELIGVDLADPVVATGGASVSAPSAISLTRVIDSLAIDGIVFSFSQTALNANASQTEDWKTDIRYGASHKTFATDGGTENMTWTGTFSGGGHAAIAFRPYVTPAASNIFIPPAYLSDYGVM